MAQIFGGNLTHVTNVTNQEIISMINFYLQLNQVKVAAPYFKLDIFKNISVHFRS